jgi:large subunit ribosomal protein L25
VANTALALRAREQRGKGAARKLRGLGRIPGVLYGPKIGSVSVDLESRSLERILRESGANALLDLAIDGRADLAESVALVKELQRHPVRGELLHVDLYQVDLAQTVEVAVPLNTSGRSEGVEAGGILDVVIHEITVRCLPRDIPESLEVDVSALQIGDVIHAGQVALPAGVELAIDAELGVVHVVAPAVEEEPVAEELAEGEEAALEGEDAEAAADGAGGEPAASGEDSDS